MCQPGRPRPQGASQAVSSPSFCAFHSAKSSGSSLAVGALDALALVHLVQVGGGIARRTPGQLRTEK